MGPTAQRGVALLFSAPALAFSRWCQRKPQELPLICWWALSNFYFVWTRYLDGIWFSYIYFQVIRVLRGSTWCYFTILMNGYCLKSKVDEARKLFDKGNWNAKGCTVAGSSPFFPPPPFFPHRFPPSNLNSR